MIVAKAQYRKVKQILTIKIYINDPDISIRYIYIKRRGFFSNNTMEAAYELPRKILGI